MRAPATHAEPDAEKYRYQRSVATIAEAEKQKTKNLTERLEEIGEGYRTIE
jgi:hypothetical protein